MGPPQPNEWLLMIMIAVEKLKLKKDFTNPTQYLILSMKVNEINSNL